MKSFMILLLVSCFLFLAWATLTVARPLPGEKMCVDGMVCL